jgi:DNA polymerase III delta prime subunit
MYNDDFLWCEKYRPKTVSECILPDSIKNTFQEYVNKKEIPNLLLTGQAGSGKTSLAKALCNEVGCDYLFLNGSSENGIDTFRTKITNYASSVSLSGGKKVIIIDEADFLTPQVFAALRAGIESFSKNCTFILTGNFKNKFPEAIQSRCSSIDFSIGKDDKKNLITQFFKRVCNILDKEDIEYDKPSVAEFITKYFPDNRKILNELQRYSVSGKIDVGVLSQVGDINLKDLIKFMKDKDFAKVREWINLNLNNDYNGVYRKLYDGMYSFLKPNSIPQVVLIIAKYQYQTGFVADPEIQMLACMTEIMVESDFK